MKIRFRVDQELCIPAMACIVAEPDLYELNDDGKAEIVKKITLENITELTREGDWVTVDTNEEGFERIVESARICPVLAIIVEKFENDEWIAVYPE